MMWSRKKPTPVSLVLYTRADCPLCDEMKAEIESARFSRPYELVEIDIDSDPALGERYGLSIPVLEIAGRAAFNGRLERGDLEKKFTRRTKDMG